MVAAKVQTPVAAKNAATNRTVQLKTLVQKDDFTKLLQQKKDVADQPKKPDSKPVDSDKVDNSEMDDKTPDSLDVKKEDMDLGDGEISVSDDEAMLQMVMEQAAVQMMIQPEITEEPVMEQAAPLETEITAVEEIHEEAVVLEPKVKSEEQPKRTEPAIKLETKTEAGEKTEAGVEEKVPQVQRQPDDKGEADQKQFEGRFGGAVTDEKRVRQVSDSVNEGQETTYASALQTNTREETAIPVIQRTEEVPIKTTVQNLPEDLGKTLATKTFEQGSVLTVELEPVSLGKLTIKLVYEGERAALSIMASNPRTLELLSQKASEIAAILEEKTGQETVIYTHQTEQGREEFEENQNSHSGQNGQEDRQQERHQEKHQTESFAQQLRLGLV